MSPSATILLERAAPVPTAWKTIVSKPFSSSPA